MPQYVWKEWGIKPTDSGVTYARNFRCHRCGEELTEDYKGRKWRSNIIGYSPYVPDPPGINPEDMNRHHDGGIVVKCPECSVWHWWHINIVYFPDYLLKDVADWPKE